jgi:hypothetical protein
MDNEHSPLGASGAERWLACPGSYGLNMLVEDQGSDYAALGTAAHELAAHCLTLNMDAWEFIGTAGSAVGYEEGQIDPDAVQVYLDLARGYKAEAERVCVEYTLGRNYRPNKYFWGTADFISIHDDKLVVMDFKYGEGVTVAVEGNPQLMYYAWGAINELSHDMPQTMPVELVICQPRAAHGEPIKRWFTTVGDITRWAKETLLPGMEKVINGDDTLAMGEHCRFCDAKLICPLMQDAFMQHDRAKDGPLCDEDLDKLYAMLPQVKMFGNALEAKVQARLTEGAKFESAKLVAKRTVRTWKDGAEEALAEALGEEAYARSLKSPAMVEKLSGKYKQFVAEWAYLPEASGYRVAPASDPAPAVNPSADLMKLADNYRN